MQQPGVRAVPVAPAEIQYASAKIKMKSGDIHEWGRCVYVLEATPNGLVLTIVAKAGDHGRSPDDRWFAPFDAVECVQLVASRLSPGIVS